jgi:hypothetical protein
MLRLYGGNHDTCDQNLRKRVTGWAAPWYIVVIQMMRSFEKIWLMVPAAVLAVTLLI